MGKNFVCAALVALGLAGGFAFPWRVSAAPVDAYPYQGQSNFSVDGTVNMVDPDRDRITVSGDNGKVYSVDTYHADIALRVTTKPGQTGDLMRGMRVHVVGALIGQDVVEADRVRVLPLTNLPAQPPTYRNDRTPNAPYPADNPDSINLRGTVTSVDNDRSFFLVRINTHTRKVFVNDATDLAGIPRAGANQLPLQAGDRVTVTGMLRSDGAVLADTVALNAPGDNTAGSSQYAPRTLTGRVTQTSNRFTTRDIKIRVSSDREMKIRVPREAAIRRDDQPISVHELNKDDIVRVYGTPDGDDFRASRIVVLQSSGDATSGNF